jgi:hypothetical protein
LSIGDEVSADFAKQTASQAFVPESTPAKRKQPWAGVKGARNSCGYQHLQRRFFHSGHGVSGWPEWEPRTYWFAKFEPQRSFDWASVGLKWSDGKEDLFSAQLVFRSGNAVQRASWEPFMGK